MEPDGQEEESMIALQQARQTADITELLQNAFAQDPELKAAIMADAGAVKKLLQAVVVDELKQDLKAKKLIARFDYPAAKETFLAGYASACTRQGYGYALRDFEAYCTAHGLQTPIAATAAVVDDWLLDQRTRGKSPATIRRNCGAVSAFFSAVERRSNGEIRNPVRGTRARPKNAPTKKDKFYSSGAVDAPRLQVVAHDIETIIASEKNKELKAILCIMAYRGLRCGAFEAMTVHGDQFRTISKGSEVKGQLPASCVQAIDAAGLKHGEPFSEWTPNRVKQAVKNHVAKLFEKGAISCRYSAHDFRHFFALTEYGRDHDIYRVSKLLGHSGIAVTEKYLRGLHVDI